MDRIKHRNEQIDSFSRKFIEPWISKNPIKVENFGQLLNNYKPNYDGYKDLYIGIKNNNYADELVLGAIYNLFLGVTQQFCFWIIPGNSNFRTKLTSGNICALTSNTDWKETYKALRDFIDENAITLRKERLEILDKAYDHIMCCYYQSIPEVIYYLLTFNEFKNDYFFKKGNLFIMEIARISEMLNNNFGNQQVDSIKLKDIMDINWSKYYGPPIDYQIPRILRELNVITYPKNIIEEVATGKLIQKDSISELSIRTLSWVAVKEIARQYNITDEAVDNIIFFNRNIIKSEKSHACLTTAY